MADELCVRSRWALTDFLFVACPSGGASDGETDGREAAGRTQVSELQGQHPQPAPVAARRPAHPVEEQTHRQIPGTAAETTGFYVEKLLLYIQKCKSVVFTPLQFIKIYRSSLFRTENERWVIHERVDSLVGS